MALGQSQKLSEHKAPGGTWADVQSWQVTPEAVKQGRWERERALDTVKRTCILTRLDWPHRLSWDSRAQTPALPVPSLFPFVGSGSEKGGLLETARLPKTESR